MFQPIVYTPIIVFLLSVWFIDDAYLHYIGVAVFAIAHIAIAVFAFNIWGKMRVAQRVQQDCGDKPIEKDTARWRVYNYLTTKSESANTALFYDLIRMSLLSCLVLFGAVAIKAVKMSKEKQQRLKYEGVESAGIKNIWQFFKRLSPFAYTSIVFGFLSLFSVIFFTSYSKKLSPSSDYKDALATFTSKFPSNLDMQSVLVPRIVAVENMESREAAQDMYDDIIKSANKVERLVPYIRFGRTTDDYEAMMKAACGSTYDKDTCSMLVKNLLSLSRTNWNTFISRLEKMIVEVDATKKTKDVTLDSFNSEKNKMLKDLPENVATLRKYISRVKAADKDTADDITIKQFRTTWYECDATNFCNKTKLTKDDYGNEEKIRAMCQCAPATTDLTDFRNVLYKLSANNFSYGDGSETVIRDTRKLLVYAAVAFVMFMFIAFHELYVYLSPMLTVVVAILVIVIISFVLGWNDKNI